MIVYVGIWRVDYEGDSVRKIASTPAGAVDDMVNHVEVWTLDGDCVRHLDSAEMAAIWDARARTAREAEEAQEDEG